MNGMQTQNGLTQRERELGAIIDSYNTVTEQLKSSYEQLREEVARLREELTKKNRQLRRRDRLAALGEMAAGVAHEIRNPLGGIRLLVSLLDKDLEDRPKNRELVIKIANGVTTLESLVTDILEFGRPSDPHPMPVELDVLVQATLEMASAKVQEKQVKVEVAPELERECIVSDPNLLQRALLNLLLNAMEATASVQDAPANRMVRIGMKSGPKEQVMLTVADGGPGVSAEMMDRIFNPFFTTKDEGTGLGLAIVHQIAETLGGSVKAANRPEGGAVFSLCLPRRLETPSDDDQGEMQGMAINMKGNVSLRQVEQEVA